MVLRDGDSPIDFHSSARATGIKLPVPTLPRPEQHTRTHPYAHTHAAAPSLAAPCRVRYRPRFVLPQLTAHRSSRAGRHQLPRSAYCLSPRRINSSAPAPVTPTAKLSELDALEAASHDHLTLGRQACATRRAFASCVSSLAPPRLGAWLALELRRSLG